MHTRTRPFAPLVILALGLAACGGGDAEEDVAPADTVAVEEAAPEGTGTGLSPSTSTVSALTVTNPMPHAMVVVVAYEGGGEAALGTVPANGEQSFTVPASPGESVTLTASDEGNTHSVDGVMVLEEQNTWTIE